jgi:hypothetical protein
MVEINEAFAAQVIPSARGIGVDPFSDKLNPRFLAKEPAPGTYVHQN